MLGVFRSSTAGMRAQQTQMDVIANNLANVNTPGFKQSRAMFSDLLYSRMSPPGEYVSLPNLQPSTEAAGLWVGAGVQNTITERAFTAGTLEATDKPLDVAIRGDGFFVVDIGDDQVGYTRDGRFTVDGEGILRTSQGFKVLPEVAMPPDAREVQVTPDGLILAVVGDPGETVQIGELQLARFINPNGLITVGDNLYLASVNSGEPEIGYPSEGGFGELAGGFVESSNVDTAIQMTELVKAQRAYQFNARALQTMDEMVGLANNLRR